jgi:hypothetical protein
MQDIFTSQYPLLYTRKVRDSHVCECEMQIKRVIDM